MSNKNWNQKHEGWYLLSTCYGQALQAQPTEAGTTTPLPCDRWGNRDIEWSLCFFPFLQMEDGPLGKRKQSTQGLSHSE